MKKFELSQFVDVKFLSARDKFLTAKQWQTFIKKLACTADKRKLYYLFTNRLYKHLTLHLSFIAHYDRQTFFYTYFTNSTDLKLFIKWIKYGFNNSLSDYTDINCIMESTLNQYFPENLTLDI